jgi:hypothetical protein
MQMWKECEGNKGGRREGDEGMKIRKKVDKYEKNYLVCFQRAFTLVSTINRTYKF